MIRVVAGVFVGGASTRMMGRPKGLLPSLDGGTLVDRACAVLRAAGVSDIVLVGAHAAYAELGAERALETLADSPPGIGPLGGLIALLRYAQAHPAGPARALAVACDMPFVSQNLIERVLAAPDDLVVAPRSADRWEPLCARYDAAVLPLAETQVAAGDHSLQRLLAAAGAIELPLWPSDARALQDWDTPEDMLTRR